MWYDKNMEYYKRINEKFNKGLMHGTQGIYKPGFITGIFRIAYLTGLKEGRNMRALKDFKK